MRKVPVAWEALEDAFENNAPEVHSYLHLDTGEVIRIVDGVAEPSMHGRIMGDTAYLRVDPVSSREQYRWMERFIATVDDAELRHKLFRAIDGKGAFRRFKDVLMSYPVDRERWFVFRSERVQACMEAWLTAHGIEVVDRPQWRVPSADEVKTVAMDDVIEEDMAAPVAAESPTAVAPVAISPLQRLHAAAAQLSSKQLELAVEFLEFLVHRTQPSSGEGVRSSRVIASAAHLAQGDDVADDAEVAVSEGEGVSSEPVELVAAQGS